MGTYIKTSVQVNYGHISISFSSTFGTIKDIYNEISRQ